MIDTARAKAALCPSRRRGAGFFRLVSGVDRFMENLYTNSEHCASINPVFWSPKVNTDLPILVGMDHSGFSERFREACQDAKVTTTMEGMGRFFGVSKAMAWNYYKGIKLPSMEKAIEIAEKLGVCVEWLLTGRGPKYPPKPPDETIDISEISPEMREGLRTLIDSMKSATKDSTRAA